MARPTKDTPARRDAILLALSKGDSRAGAAAAAGIDRGTLRLWAARDPALAEAIEAAEARAVARFNGVIWEAAPKDWRAAAWWLERRVPETYGRRARLDATVARFDVEAAAKRIAAESGLDPAMLVAEAERIVMEFRRP
jgi:hypothetical protein